ncbi:isopenicillin N synthase family oxygenase [Rhodobacteraceae bacterium CCMM004]|nr:isopenicillin N synthase family oxygenase [Rhodobacteraceae bacterium CCMM004]
MIPCFDAARLADRAPADLADLAAAARGAGFLTVTGTAISSDELRALLGHYRGFFHRPRAVKAEVDMAATGSNRGWGGPRSERVDPTANPDFKEVFDMGYTLPPGDPLAVYGRKYYAPNRWPEDMPAFRAALEDYYTRASAVALDLLEVLAAALGMPEGYFATRFDRPMALLRSNWYPPRPDWAGSRDFGIAPHTDYGCLTLLATDGAPGLEVQGPDGAWHPVAAAPGTFVVNFGEMLAMWTGGQVSATLHRVVGTERERLSVPLFFNPNYDTDVAPPGSAAPILAGDHLSRRYDETYVHLTS